jgi:hypothetical protein
MSRIEKTTEKLVEFAESYGYGQQRLNYQELVTAYTNALVILNSKQHELTVSKERHQHCQAA